MLLKWTRTLAALLLCAALGVLARGNNDSAGQTHHSPPAWMTAPSIASNFGGEKTSHVFGHQSDAAFQVDDDPLSRDTPHSETAYLLFFNTHPFVTFNAAKSADPYRQAVHPAIFITPPLHVTYNKHISDQVDPKPIAFIRPNPRSPPLA